MFCAVFPKDFEMVKEQLIPLWMANGLITSRENLQMVMRYGMNYTKDHFLKKLKQI
jgi:hypothetical protein